MEQEPENAAETEEIKDAITKPVIPPPDLSRPPPPPPSPMESMPKPPPSSLPPAERLVPLPAEVPVHELPTGSIVPFNTRAIAAVIDVAVSMGLTIGASMVLPNFIAGKVAGLLGIAYLITRDSLPFLHGQSVGKKAMKIKALTLDGQPLTNNWEKAFIRNGVLMIPFFGLVELFILLTRDSTPDRGKRLGDEWAKTKVVIAERPPVEETPV